MSSKIKDRFILKFYRFYLWLMRLYVKHIFKCQRKNRNILFYILLEDFREKYKTESIDFRVKLASSVLDKLLPPYASPENNSDNPDEIFVPYETERFLNIPEINNFLLNHYRLSAFAYSYFDKEKSENAIQNAKEINESIDPLTSKTYNILSKQISKEFKKASKVYKQNLKIKKEEEKISKRRKIDFSITEIKAIFGLTSILFLFSGYIYNHLFLSYFGIEVSKFFTINDYVSTSIDKIYSIVFALIINMVITFFWWSPEYIEARKKMSTGRLLFEDGPFYIIFLGLPVASVVISYLDKPGKYYFLALTIFFVFQYFVPKIADFFKKPLLSSLIISYIALFFIILISGTLEERENIVKYYSKNDLNYYVEFDLSIDIKQKNLYLLSTNSNFSFLYSREKKQAYVVPNKHIKIIAKKDIPEKGFLQNMIDLMMLLNKKENSASP